MSCCTTSIPPYTPDLAAVGIGGQAVWLADDRQSLCEGVLARLDPSDYECLKSLSTALVTQAQIGHGPHRDGGEQCEKLNRAVQLLR